MEWADLLIALIWTSVLGATLGNYATSFVYRLPANEPMFDKHPFCGSCKTFLKNSDLFPVISYLKNRGKCAYCSAPIPPAHFYVELASIMVMISAYFTLGFGEPFVLVILLGLLSIIYSAIAWRSGYSEMRVLYGIIAVTAAMRLIADHSIYPMFFDAFIPLLIAALLVRKGLLPKEVMWLWAAIGLLVPWPYSALVIVALQLTSGICRLALPRPETRDAFIPLEVFYGGAFYGLAIMRFLAIG